MHRKTSVAAVAVLVAISWAARAQTLTDALEQAWKQHPLGVSSPSSQSAAQARIAIANALTPGPAAVSLSTLDDQLGANRGKKEWEWEIETPLWLPGQRGAAQAEAMAAQQHLDAQHKALRLELAGEVREKWWAVAVARGDKAMAAQRVQAAQALVSDVDRRVGAGELARTDANLAHMEQLAAQAELDEAQSALLQAEDDFRVLTGTEPAQPLASESLPAQAPAVEEHPQLLAAAARVDLAAAKLALAQRSERDSPTLALRMVRDRADFSETFSDAFGIKLTIPFSMGGRTRQELSNNQSEVLQAQTDHAQTRRRLAVARETSQRVWKASQFQLELAASRLTRTQDNLSLLEKSFALGESDLPALLRARAAHFDAQALLYRQQISGYAALSRVNQALGVLP